MREPTTSTKRRSTTRILVNGGLWNNFSSIVPIAINIIMTPFVIHGFGIARWGLFVLVSSISNFFGPLNAGLGGTTGRFCAIYAARDDRVKTSQTVFTLLFVSLGLGIVATVLSWFISPYLIHLFGIHGALTGEGTFLLRTLGVLVAVSFIHNLFASVVSARQRWALTNSMTVGSYVVWTVGLVLCVDLHLGLRGVAFVFVGQQVVAILVILPTSFRYLTVEGCHFLSLPELKAVSSYAGSIQLIGIITLVNQEVDTLLIGALFPIRKVAFYNTGANFASQLRSLTLNFLGPAGMYMSQTYGRGGADAANQEFRRIQRLWIILASGYSAAGTGAAYFAIVAWIGPSFRLGGEVAMVAMAGYVASLWTGALTQYLGSVGRPAIEARYALVSMVINIALTIPLALVGPLGITAATSIGMVVASLYLVRIARKQYREDIPHFLRDVPVVASLVTLATTFGLEALVRPYAPSGPLGLLFCSLPAICGLILFVLIVLRSSLLFLVQRALSRTLTVKLVVEALLKSQDTDRDTDHGEHQYAEAMQ